MNTQEFKLRRKALSIAVAAALTSLVSISQADTVITTTAPVGGKDNGAGGYSGGAVTLGDGSAQTINGGFLPRVDQSINRANLNVLTGATNNLIAGRLYNIQTLGTTNFTLLGASTNTVGLAFTANATTPVGSGIVTDTANLFGGYNSLDNLKLIIKANTTINPATSAAVLVEDDNIEGLITQKNYSIAVMTNGGSSITNFGAIKNIDGGLIGNNNAVQSTNVGVQLGNNGDKLILKNGGSVEASMSVEKIGRVNSSTGPNTAKAYGVNTDAAGEYFVTVDQGGSISASHGGIGGAYAIDGGGSSNSITIDNAGTISGTRITPIKAASLSAGVNVLPTALKGQLNSSDATYSAALNALTAQSIGNIAAIYVQEELDTVTLNNRKTGILQTTGDLTDTLYLRATEQNVKNDGVIRVNGYTAANKNGMAISSVSDSMRLQKLNLENNGDITGDIAVVNGNALRYWAIKKYGNAGDDLKINSGAGQIDSSINNTGTIVGDVYYSNGQHSLMNTGTLTGNINVDQRDTVCGLASGAAQSCGIKANSITNHVLSEHLEYTIGADGKVVNDANTSFNGTFTMHGAKAFTFENSGTFTGNLNIVTVNGLTGTYSNVYGVTVSKDNSQITLIPTFSMAGASSAATAAASSGGFINGTLTIKDGVGVDSANSTTTLAPKVAVTVKNGDWFKVASSYTNAPNDLPMTESSALVSWTAAKEGNSLVVGATVAGASDLGFTGNQATTLNALLASNSVAAAAVQNYSRVSDIAKATEELRPEINGANIQASLGITERVFGLVDSHLSDTHLAEITGKTGISTGEQTNGVGVWLEGIGMKSNQDRRESVDGYNTNAYGFALGVDKSLDHDIRAGAALSYANSTIKADGVNLGNHTDIDTYQATIYGSKLMGIWYLNGTLGLGLHQYDTKRQVIGNTVSGSHDAWQYSAKLDAGYPLKLGSATFTPIGSLAYSHLSQDGFSESGVGALNVASNNVDSFKTGLGAKAMIPLSTSGGFNTALLGKAIWSHEFSDVQQDTTANFVGGNTSFTTNGVSVARDGLNLGASLVLTHTDKDVVQNLSISYDADVKDQYLSHTARLQARFDF